jgi:hypothetical protein
VDTRQSLHLAPCKLECLTIFVHHQHKRFAGSLVALHDVGDGVLALLIKRNIDGTALVIDGSDDCERRQYWLEEDAPVLSLTRVLSEIS